MELQSTALPTELRGGKGPSHMIRFVNTTLQRGLPEVTPIKVHHHVGSIYVYSRGLGFRLGLRNANAPITIGFALILGHQPFPPPKRAPTKIRTWGGGFKVHSVNQLHHRSRSLGYYISNLIHFFNLVDVFHTYQSYGK